MEFTNFKIVEQSLKDQVSGVKGKASSAIKKGAWRIFSSIIRFIVTNPYALAITIAIIGGTIAYTIYSIDYQLTSIMEQYQALSAKPFNSKSGYDKRVMYVSTDSNGKPVLTVGYKSELEAEEVQQALEEAGVIEEEFSGSSSGGNTWDGDGLQLKADDMYSHYKFTGVGSVTDPAISINGVNLYSGIPWSDDGNWYELNLTAVSNYLNKNLGTPLSNKTAFHTDNYNTSNPIKKNDIFCAGIAWMPIFCFCDVDNTGAYNPGYSGTLAGGEDRYGVAVLEKNGQKFYFPICGGGDNKGHVWPGGLVQTYVGNGTTLDMNSGMIKFSSGGNKSDIIGCKWGNEQINGKEMSLKDFVDGWKTKMNYNGALATKEGHPMLSLELNSAYINSGLKEYKIVGFIMHR